MSAPARWPDFAVDLGPELEAAMEEHLAAVEAIADGPWPPTFDDTVAALERARHRLDLAEHMLDDRAGARLTDPIEALEAQMRPRLAAHKDAVGLDRRIFARIADLVARRDALGLDADQAGALDRYHRDLIRGGAALDAGAQARMRAINERLAVLRAEFRRRLLAETRDLAVRVDDVAELDGLPRAMIDAAAAAAAGDGYLLTLALPSVQPAHEFLHDRALRERLYRASVSRGRRGGEHDTRATVIEIT
ncbi:MAG: peptidyl-dipeptidase Dcp, partial [Solirubrobacteraceae bacterium]|nr:peptidyl-dipeptidase Dcp [Solirubrobacteraceae bacterium]